MNCLVFPSYIICLSNSSSQLSCLYHCHLPSLCQTPWLCCLLHCLTPSLALSFHLPQLCHLFSLTHNNSSHPFSLFEESISALHSHGLTFIQHYMRWSMRLEDAGLRLVGWGWYYRWCQSNTKGEWWVCWAKGKNRAQGTDGQNLRDVNLTLI